MLSLKENKDYAKEHFNLIEAFITKKINSIIKRKYFTYKWKKIALLPSELKMLNDINTPKFLEDLITCPPIKLNKLIRVSNIYRVVFQDKDSNLYKAFMRIFFHHGYEKMDNLTFIARLGIDTCPYCNRNYIYYLDATRKIKPEIDHLYSKTIYPLFSASYYNLIPCCQTCNGFGGKGISDTYKTKLTSPYLIKQDDFKLTYKLNSLARIHPISGRSSVDVLFLKSLKPHLDVFKLDALYNKHSDHALELIVKSRLKYNKKYRDYLRSYKGLHFSEIEIDRLILGNYSKENELHKRPLSILYRDIGKQLGLI